MRIDRDCRHRRTFTSTVAFSHQTRSIRRSEAREGLISSSPSIFTRIFPYHHQRGCRRRLPRQFPPSSVSSSSFRRRWFCAKVCPRAGATFDSCSLVSRRRFLRLTDGATATVKRSTSCSRGSGIGGRTQLQWRGWLRAPWRGWLRAPHVKQWA